MSKRPPARRPRRPKPLDFPGPATRRELDRFTQAMSKRGLAGAELLKQIRYDLGEGLDQFVAALLGRIRRKFE